MQKRIKFPWPTKKVMEQIYKDHLWGGIDEDFYSGEGSHHDSIVQPYLAATIGFLESHDDPLTVCDLGCGDFNIGRQLTPYVKSYVGVDIVASLIKRNQDLYANDHITFKCLDISKDRLPQADCAILRQVLQHLSNQEIQQILNQLRRYKYLILTEHIPQQAFTPNKDKIASLGIRLKQNSGVDILVSPFNFKIISKKLLHEIILSSRQGKISTCLFTLP